MDKRDYYYKQLVQEDELDQSYDWAEQAMFDLAVDNGLEGFHFGGVASEHSPTPDLTVDVSPGLGTDKLGRRLYWAGTQNVDCSQDEYGTGTASTLGTSKEKYLTIYAMFTRNLSDPAVDGNGATVWTKQYESFELRVRQGSEAAIGTATPPSIPSDALNVVDILLVNTGAPPTQIIDADLDTDRRDDWLRMLAAGFSNLSTQVAGTPHEAAQAALNLIDDLSTGTGIAFTATENWHDGSSIAAGDVSAAINEIVADLADDGSGSGIGADKIGADDYSAAISFTLTQGSVWDQLKELADGVDVAALTSADEDVTGQWDFQNFITVNASAAAGTNLTAITATAKGTGAGGVFYGGGSTSGIVWERQGIAARGGRDATTAGVGGQFIGGAPTSSGAGAHGLISSGADATSGNGGHGGLFFAGDKAGLSNDGCAVVGIGAGASTTVPAGAYGAGVYGIGGGSKHGGYFKGGSGRPGLYCEGDTNVAPLELAKVSDPTSYNNTGCLTMDSNGFLRAYFGASWRFVGTQAWAAVSTDGATNITMDGEIGFDSVSIIGNAARLTFDDNMSNANFAAVATYFGANTYIARITGQATTYVEVSLFDDAGLNVAIGSTAVKFNVVVFGK